MPRNAASRLPKKVAASGPALALVLACFCACSSSPPTVSVTLTPETAEVYVTRSMQFKATVRNAEDDSVTWSLSGTGCSGADCGTIDTDGNYQAPATVPDPPIVRVTATSSADASKSASASVTVLGPITIEWTWEAGSNLAYTPGVFGTRGVPDATSMPGGREAPAAWVDGTGDFWVFGGSGMDATATGEQGDLNDLWRLDMTTFAWTWLAGSPTRDQPGIHGVRGTAAPTNVPGSRHGAVAWIDASGDLWLFGGRGYDAIGNEGRLNDLWKFDVGTFEWTWMAGSSYREQPGVYGTKGTAAPANYPGARVGAAAWVDTSGAIWLFGGSGLDTTEFGGWLNDLWKYDPQSGLWAWISGASSADQPGVYGALGVPHPANVPGARQDTATWRDPAGRLWLLGGMDFHYGQLNDLWNFDPTTTQWTWISGGTSGLEPGRYGTRGIPEPSNVPGGRYGAETWLDAEGRLWLFGGHGWDSMTYQSVLSDLWRFDPVTLEWAWVSGSSRLIEAVVVYGTKGVPDPQNIPGRRDLAPTWRDSRQRFWLFGGVGVDAADGGGYLNDLWQFVIK